MKTKVWTCTTDGDNQGIETTAHANEKDARAGVEAALQGEGVSRWNGGWRLSELSLEELAEAWEQTFDGACIIEEHELALEPVEA